MITLAPRGHPKEFSSFLKLYCLPFKICHKTLSDLIGHGTKLLMTLFACVIHCIYCPVSLYLLERQTSLEMQALFITYSKILKNV